MNTIRRIRKRCRENRSTIPSANDRVPWYSRFTYAGLYGLRYDKSINNHYVLCGFFASVSSLIAIRFLSLSDSSNLVWFSSIQSLISIIGLITLFDVHLYVGPWQVRGLPMYAILPWPERKLVQGYAWVMLERSLVFILTSFFISIGYCFVKPAMQTSINCIGCLLATFGTMVSMVSLSILLTTISSYTIRYRLYLYLFWLRSVAILVLLGYIPAVLFPWLITIEWIESSSLLRFLPPNWPIAILHWRMEGASRAGVLLASFVLMALIAATSLIAWRRLYGRLRIIEFMGNDNRFLHGLLAVDHLSSEEYLRCFDGAEPIDTSKSVASLVDEAVSSNDSPELMLRRYRDQFWQRQGSIQWILEGILSKEERTCIAAVYHSRGTDTPGQIVKRVVLFSLAWLPALVVSKALASRLPIGNVPTLVALLGIAFLIGRGSQYVSAMHLHLWRFFPFSTATLVGGLWKFTLVYWLFLLGVVCPFWLVGFSYMGWSWEHTLQAIAIACVWLPCMACAVHLVNLFVGTRQRIEAVDFMICVFTAALFIVLGLGIVAWMFVVENPFIRIAISFLSWPLTLLLYRWSLYRYHHRTLEVGSPWHR